MSTTFLESQELQIAGARAILVRISFPEDVDIARDEALDELESLAETAGITPSFRIGQSLTRPDARTFCGKGKVEEIAALCLNEDISLVIFDNDLKPQQQRVISDTCKARVMDRTELILMIFYEHARTHQSKVAVELAQLQYSLPRLRNLWNHLERQRGALGKVGGAGELQVETDRRLLRDRITRLRRELDAIERRREVEVGRRKELFQIAIVGYTNAGKSTLMNALTNADVYVADQLFATLDTRTRILEIGDHKALLSDTVGFIRKLPHSLVASFHATLSEAMHADLLMHVVDVSHPAAEHMIRTVDGVLEELGASGKRTLLVFNKVDNVKDKAELAWMQERYPAALCVSAKSGAGLTLLKEHLELILEEREIRLELRISAGNGKLLAFLRDKCKVLGQEWEGSNVNVSVLAEPRWVHHINQMNAEMPVAEEADSSSTETESA